MRSRVERVEAAFTDAAESTTVEMTVATIAPDRYRASSAAGSTTFRRATTNGTEPTGEPVERFVYEVEDVTGSDPLATRDDAHLAGLADEVANARPDRDQNSFPHAFDQIAQFFDAPHAPDLVVQHTSAHSYGGNIGQHGSLGIVQARAPFIAAGPGVPTLGAVPRSARMVDVAPTVLHLLGTDAHPDAVGPTGAPRPSGLLRRQDGDPIELMERGAARRVVVVLLDGCNANVLADACTTGGAPTIASLSAKGLSLEHGLMASLPTATLANHTTASTGAHPGHSGVLHNMWLDRARSATPDLLAMDQVFDAMRHLAPDVETVHQAIHRSRPEAFTAALFEFCDTGADVSSFAAFREQRAPHLPTLGPDDDVHHHYVESSGAYGFMSSVDELATRQAVELWGGHHGTPLPDFTFLALSLTDEAGHETGPYSDMVRAAIADSDRRVERLLGAVESAGALDDTAVLVIADHGMQESDPSVAAGWDHVVAGLRDDGVGLTDVADGFLYLDA